MLSTILHLPVFNFLCTSYFACIILFACLILFSPNSVECRAYLARQMANLTRNNFISVNINKDYIEIYENLKSRNLDRKEFAIRAKEYRHSNILFNMLDGKEHKQNIWKIIYPNYSKPFKKDEA